MVAAWRKRCETCATVRSSGPPRRETSRSPRRRFLSLCFHRQPAVLQPATVPPLPSTETGCRSLTTSVRTFPCPDRRLAHVQASVPVMLVGPCAAGLSASMMCPSCLTRPCSSQSASKIVIHRVSKSTARGFRQPKISLLGTRPSTADGGSGGCHTSRYTADWERKRQPELS
jgi:hypothetical protein